MEGTAIAALIAGAVALTVGIVTAWSSLRNTRVSTKNTIDIEVLKQKNAREIQELQQADAKRKEEAIKREKTSNFSEPLARSAYDLQSRLFNILKKNLINGYLVSGTDRTKSYIVDNTTFLISQYFSWTEIVRREIQFIDLGEDANTRKLLRLQDNLYRTWGTDAPRLLRIFAGEQREVGEALIVAGTRGQECMGYGAFLKMFVAGQNPLIDAIREDVMSLATDLQQATPRLIKIQHALIDLLKILDPEYLRFPEETRSKVSLSSLPTLQT